MMWKLQALLYRISPRILDYWNQFTFAEWLAIAGCGIVVVILL